MNSPEHVFDIKNLNAWFFKNHVLHDINMQVEKDKVLAIIGPSGCGKSTFIRCLNRLHEEIRGAKISGEVYLENKNIYKKNTDSVSVRKKVGMVFQKPAPFPGMSVYDNVAIGLKFAGVKKQSLLDEKVETALKDSALWEEVKDQLDKPGTSLSGGQQQRLCIARALAVDPSVILMDEPTSALDPISTIWIEELIQKLKKQVTVIVVTHNMQQAAKISDRIAFLLKGQLIEYNKTSLFFTNPTDPRSEKYITGRF